MQLLILATLVTVFGAGQTEIRDHSSDSDNDIEIHVIKWEISPIEHNEPLTTTEPPSTRITDPSPRIHKPEKSRTTTPETITERTTSTTDGWITSHNHSERRIHIHIPELKKSRISTPETTTERTTEGARTIATRKTTTSKTTTSKAINEKTTSTTDGWISHLRNSYKVYKNAKNFDDAENRCREYGAHLVSVHSEPENQFVQSLTTTGLDVNSWRDFVYIGMRKNTQTGNWYWTDGSKVDYMKWATDQPDHPESELCVQLMDESVHSALIRELSRFTAHLVWLAALPPDQYH
ncbi:lectin C-type domain protein [Ancylostoma ceylanicum]|uniref:Lectin C-type domain protein n=1 Tax=Ancylostoma ceylanicum TaxID=53326 RepID=A0A0D6LSS9_9BILA|nr:lectin C-type domain protein [Ancylostoma ceylanicum]